MNPPAMREAAQLRGYLMTKPSPLFPVPSNAGDHPRGHTGSTC